MDFLVNKWFTSNNKKYLIVKGKTCSFRDNPIASKGYLTLQKGEILLLINHIVKESYVYFNNKIYRQNQGVPMGGNASPYLADLTLSVLEYKFFISRNVTPSYKIVRYVDDILVFNSIECPLYEIYNGLDIERTNGSCSAHFLDLNIKFGIHTKFNVIDKKEGSNKFNILVAMVCFLSCVI